MTRYINIAIVGIIEVVLFAFLAISLFVWVGWRDRQLLEWADKYESCVAEKYHTTPSRYYADNGNYPYCETQ